MSHHTEIYLIRHTQPLIGVGICYGQLDCALADNYDKQLMKLSGYLKDKTINAIYSSPLQRCAKLAEDLSSAHFQLPVIYQHNFQEINFGDWEGLKWDNIPRGKIDEWNNNRLDFQFPNGETPSQFHSRVLKGLSTLATPPQQKTSNRKILLIAHAGVIRSILCHYLHIPFYHSTRLRIDYASISKISLVDNVASCHFVNRLLN